MTTCVTKELSKVHIVTITFHTDMSRGHTGEKNEDLVLQRLVCLRTNPPCRPIWSGLIWCDEGTHLPLYSTTPSILELQVPAVQIHRYLNPLMLTYFLS